MQRGVYRNRWCRSDGGDARMAEKHYAHLSPSYVADTIRQNFPALGIVEDSNVTTLRR